MDNETTFYLGLEDHDGNSTIFAFHTAAPITEEGFIAAVDAEDGPEISVDVDDVLNRIADRIQGSWERPICSTTLYTYVQS